MEDIQQKSVEIGKQPDIFCLLTLEKPLYANIGSTLVGYKFDGDINDNVCRLAFYGKIIVQVEQKDLKLYKFKNKEGEIEKLVDNYMVIVKNLFKKDVDINKFIGKEVEMELSSNTGRIHSTFGNSGKVKVVFDKPVLSEGVEEEKLIGSKVTMKYRKYYGGK